MSRDVDVHDPDSWSDADKTWLSSRMHLVPEEHRDQLTAPPQREQMVKPGISPQMDKLTQFVKTNYPDRADEDPVDVVISELGGDVEPEEEGDDYDKWTLSELRDEGKTRADFVAPTGEDAKKKPPWIEALRAWDAQHPVVV